MIFSLCVFNDSDLLVLSPQLDFENPNLVNLFSTEFAGSKSWNFVEIVTLIMDVDQFLSTVFPSKRDEDIATPRYFAGIFSAQYAAIVLCGKSIKIEKTTKLRECLLNSGRPTCVHV